VEEKHQIPSKKCQMNSNHPNPKQNIFAYLRLEFGAYLGFACLPVGREFLIWDFKQGRWLKAIWLYR
jgi:hypothetical protein